MTSETVATRLCLSCGLCCNGVLFRDVELQSGDDAAHLAAAGMPLRAVRRSGGTISRSPQPCAMLCADNKCRVYESRPSRCREFECVLFKAVTAGEVTVDAALKTIRQAHSRAEKVRRLLRATGDDEEHRPLTQRFQRIRRRLESGTMDETALESFADLTMAVHALNLLLSQRFYPGA